ncbi:hypothetical protein RvY_15176 [Ramazzottius varieornatus]|uniref:m7GpppX diphosphatase n=1 Tax=Ramazzottius varieornatus TaxID=947166 RepID=A0A1D1VTZ8_RAMVA|nr:hypothetical protein RvY_15176 [Ramazzottius varieornatus]
MLRLFPVFQCAIRRTTRRMASTAGKTTLDTEEDSGLATKKQKTSSGEANQSREKQANGHEEKNGSSLVKESNVFERFKFTKLLKADPSRKTAFVQGTFDDGSDAMIILEKLAFESDSMEKMFQSEALGQLAFKNDVYHNYLLNLDPKFNATKATLIYPAAQSHFEKHMPQIMHIVNETAEDYRDVTEPYLKTSKRFDTKWVDNILDHEKETERIVFEDPDPETGFVLLPDLKWDGSNVDSLYLVALVHKRGIHSIRDLRGFHLPMLQKIQDEGLSAIKKKYGLPPSHVRAYFHYQPTFYHLHIHFSNVLFDAPGRNAEKAHMLSMVISNLTMNSEYFTQATIPFMLGEKDPLFQLYKDKLEDSDNVHNQTETKK